MPRVWIIDDSPTVRDIVGACLRRAGCEVIGFSDGVTAIRWLQFGAGVPDLFLVDLLLPNMDGYDLIRFLRSYPIGSQIPCIVMSRRGGFLDRLKARLLGADYLIKPFEMTSFLAVVQRALGTNVSEEARQ